MIVWASLVTGALFAWGLVLGGMTQPGKVIGFLDVTGDWDPSLAFVMAGAIAVFAPGYRWITRNAGPNYESLGLLPVQHIDARLILGSLLFGAGWGMAGFCPGPALVAAGTLQPKALLFVVSMLLGMLLFRGWQHLSDRLRDARPIPSSGDPQRS